MQRRGTARNLEWHCARVHRQYCSAVCMLALILWLDVHVFVVLSACVCVLL